MAITSSTIKTTLRAICCSSFFRLFLLFFSVTWKISVILYKVKKGVIIMATSSITKQFVIKDDKACDRLIEILNRPSRRKKTMNSSNKYLEGKKKLVQYFGP